MNMLRKKSKNKGGFTLVELVIVIAILAILAVTAIVGYTNLQASAKDSIDKANANVIVRALNTYNALVLPAQAKDGPSALTATVIGDLKITAPIAIDLSVTGLTADEITGAIAWIDSGVQYKYSIKTTKTP